MAKTRRAVVVDQDINRGGLAAELAAVISGACFETLLAPVQRIGRLPVPVPGGLTGDLFIHPNVEQVVDAIHATTKVTRTGAREEDTVQHEPTARKTNATSSADGALRRPAVQQHPASHRCPHGPVEVGVTAHPLLDRGRLTTRSTGFAEPQPHLPSLRGEGCGNRAPGLPHINASVAEDALLAHHRINLGIAVNLDAGGLVVPVVHDATR